MASTSLGPVLKFLGVQNDAWGVSLLMVLPAAQAAPQLTVNGSTQAAQKLLDLPSTGNTAWRASFSLPLQAASRKVSYSVDGTGYDLHVPAQGQMPCIAYASCNGFSDPKLMKDVSDKNALWTRLLKLHTRRELTRDQTHGPFNLLLMGGDQIYSDAMWAVCPSLLQWCELPSRQRWLAPFTPEMAAQVRMFFERTYIDRWSQPEMNALMSSVPSVMMWDDHDIMDGWGSYPDEQHHCAVYQGIYQIARECFAIFQQHSAPGSPAPCVLPGQTAYTSVYSIGDMAILAIDMRSERQPEFKRGAQYWPDQVLSQSSWDCIFAWMTAQEKLPKPPAHLLIMTSIPVVHPDYQTLEMALNLFPGQQELEDDLRDQWTSRAHLQERLRFIKRCLEFSAKSHCRVTLLSGDVHVAAVGVIESDRNDVPPNARVINQLTSSGIVHPAPPGIALTYLEHNSADVVTVDRGITTQMYEFPASHTRFIGARNVLTIEPDDVNRLWANWWVENIAHAYTKVIHPVQSTAKDVFVEPSSGTPDPAKPA
jgi:PhoD related phosphatase